ncbi:interleukininterleukin-6 [Podarcis lilfordi]|uniref:Interleukin-6 n=1 Tax=Podarcis lilfordi TaxID=74358 RepID=A0AA35P0V1_9SAUR|nr:interleukininterleukin-6 [Podarcis lilfordi]
MCLLPGCGLHITTFVFLLVMLPVVDASAETSTVINLAASLKQKATEWDQELCAAEGACKPRRDFQPEFNIRLPKINKEDKCSPDDGFEKETCLRGLSSGLYQFRVFLEYLQESLSISETPPVKYIWPTTENLASSLMSMMQNSKTVTPLDPDNADFYSKKLASYSNWQKILIQHVILQKYISFMEKIVGAFRYM